MRQFFAFVWVTVVVTGYVVADTSGEAYFEHKTDRHVVRISRGPGEPCAIGSYAIRVYDSAGLDLIAGAIKPRDGELVKSWVTAADQTREMRVWIWTSVVGSGAYGAIELLQFDGNSFREVRLPSPGEPLLKGYMGHDIFEIMKGNVYRQFPLYRPNDSNSNPTGGTRCLVLDLEETEWKLSNHRIDSGSK